MCLVRREAGFSQVAAAGYLFVFLFKPDVRVLTLFEDHCNEFGLVQFLQSRLVRAVLSNAFHGGGCHVVNPSPPP